MQAWCALVNLTFSTCQKMGLMNCLFHFRSSAPLYWELYLATAMYLRQLQVAMVLDIVGRQS